MHSPPGYRKRRDALSQTTHFFRAKRERARRATSPEQSGKVWPGGRFARAKRKSPPRPATFQEQSGKARARRLLQSKARKPTAPVGLRQSKVRKPTTPLGLRQSKAEKRRPAAFPEQSAKARHRTSPEQSGKVWPAGPFRRAKRRSAGGRLSQSKARKPGTPLSQSKAEKCGPRARPAAFAKQSAKGGGGRFRTGKCESFPGPRRARFGRLPIKQKGPPGLSQTTQKRR